MRTPKLNGGARAAYALRWHAVGRAAGRFPLVLANIESRVLVPLAGELCARVAPAGVLVLGGLLAPERERLLAAYSALHPIAVHQQGEWIAIELRSGDG